MFEHLKHKASDDWQAQEIKSLMQQLVHDPDNYHVLTRLGRLHFAPDNQAMAFHYLWQAQDISKEKSFDHKPCRHAMMALGELLMRRGQYADARRKYMEVLSIDILDKEALGGKHAAEAGLDAERENNSTRENPDAEGVRRFISPQNYQPRFSSHKKADRVSGMAIVELICQ